MLTEQQVRDALNGAIEPQTRNLTTEDVLRAVIRQAIAVPMARAAAELPSGTAAEQLRNYAGRAWEIIHTPVFAGIYRIVVAEVPEYPGLARFFAAHVSGPIQAQLELIIAQGIARGEFRPVTASAAAGALKGSLIAQAFWYNHADVWGPQGSAASRVVPETLSLLLEGLNRSSSRSLSTDGGSK
jgi:hypothetical protein